MKKITILMVVGILTFSGFVSLLTGKNVSAVESGDMQSLEEEIASNKTKLENQIAFLKNLAIKADKYIKNKSSISPSNQAQRYLEKLNKDDFYVLEYREAVMKEIEHINKLAEKKEGVYEQLPELKELQERIANAILALTDEGNFIAHIENRQKELLGEKDLNKAEQNAKMLKAIINRYFNKLRAQYGNEFLLADRFESSLITGIDNVTNQINKKIEEKMKAAEEDLKKAAKEEADRLKKDEENNSDAWEKVANEKAAEEDLKKAAKEEADRLKKDEENNSDAWEKVANEKAAEEDLKKAAKEEADRLKKDEENNSDAWEKVANEENKKNENKNQDKKLDEKQEQNSVEVKATELPENQISKKDNKQTQTLQAPNTGENQKQSFEITLIGVVSAILAAISTIVVKRR